MDNANAATKPRYISAGDLDAYWAGAQIFGPSIGGHNLSWMVAWTRELLNSRGAVPLVDPSELGDAHCAAVLVMGRMTSLLELMPTGDEAPAAVAALARRTGRAIDAVYPLDAANLNALVPLAAAAQLGVPLVDCDGMGRIFPLIHQTAMHLAGMPLGPIAASSAVGDVVVVESDGTRADALMRSMLDQLGGWAMTVLNPCNAGDLAGAALRGTVSRLMTVGQVILNSASAEEVTRGLVATVGARLVGSGHVIQVEHGNQRAGVAHPSLPSSVVVVERSAPSRVMQLEVQNEILLAQVDGRIVATVPDTICLLDSYSGQVVGADQVRVSDAVEIVVLPAAPVWRTDRGLALAGPRAFGIPVNHHGGYR